jgi:alpha-tubulin suppressor-like RCC1 family protein
VCWGRNDTRQLEFPSGRFREISAGTRHACAIAENGALACWGLGGAADPADGSDPNGESWGQAVPPSGSFVAVSAGTFHTCGIQDDGAVICWGAGKTAGDCRFPSTSAVCHNRLRVLSSKSPPASPTPVVFEVTVH